MTAEIEVDRKKVQQEAKRVLTIEKKDVQMSIVKMIIEIESKMSKIATSLELKPNLKNLAQLSRELYKRGVLSEHTINSIRVLWNIRNNTVHARGRQFSGSEARAALDLSATVLVALKEIQTELRSGERGS